MINIADKVCKYCGQQFKAINTKVFSNHVRWCDKNTKYDNQKCSTKLASSMFKYHRKKLGQIKQFNIKCHICDKQFIVKQRQKLFPIKDRYYCSNHCAKVYASTVNKEQTNKKISQTLKNNWLKTHNPHPVCYCKVCNKEIDYKNKFGYCQKCFRQSQEASLISRNAILKRIAAGLHKGWASTPTSYPQKFFIKILDNHNIKYDLHYMSSNLGIFSPKNCTYYYDFWIPDKCIDLQIDGRQHKEEKYKQNDAARDFISIKSGVIPYRIRWSSINTKNGKQYIKNQIDKFLQFYDNIRAGSVKELHAKFRSSQSGLVASRSRIGD